MQIAHASLSVLVRAEMDTSVSEENYMFPTADRTAVTVDIQYVSDIDPIRPQQMRQEMELNQGDR